MAPGVFTYLHEISFNLVVSLLIPKVQVNYWPGLRSNGFKMRSVISHITMITNSLSDLSAQQLKKALVIRERLDVLQRELFSILGNSSHNTNGNSAPRRHLSAAARAKIAAAQRRRWARQRRMEMEPKPAA